VLAKTVGSVNVWTESINSVAAATLVGPVQTATPTLTTAMRPVAAGMGFASTELTRLPVVVVRDGAVPGATRRSRQLSSPRSLSAPAKQHGPLTAQATLAVPSHPMISSFHGATPPKYVMAARLQIL